MGFRTQRDVERLALPPGKSEVIESDSTCRGLYVRLQGATKVYLVRYQLPDGRRRKITLGDVAAVPLADARQQAGRLVALAKDGRDPLADREAKRAESADTFAALVELFISRYAERRQRPNTLRETTRALRVYLAPLHPKPLAQIGRRDVAGVLQGLVETSGGVTANRTRAALSRCFSWAMEQGLAEANPVVGTAPPAREQPRTRVLSLPELAAVWRAAGDDDFGRVIKLLVLTGQRRDEIGGMLEAELDREAAMWTIGAARAKNGRAHEVPLPPAAMALIPAHRQGRQHLYGRGQGGFSGWSKSKERLDAKLPKLEAWTLHDLRRSATTGMAEAGVEPHITEALLNHVSGHKAGVGGIYNHALYREPKRAALVRWADLVLAQVARS